ncbi:MAG: amidohydrolase family protein [Clostridia bacterium]
MLFDAHVHVFPDKLEGKVLPKLSAISQSPYYLDETVSSATTLHYSMGGTHMLCLNIATNPKQQSSVNDFANSINNGNIISFGSVHPKSDDAIKELYRIKDMGLKGIKLHPDYQDFIADDKNMHQIYKVCEELNLMITFHTGKDPYSPTVIHCTPKSIQNIATSFPNLTIIAAHMGGMGMCDDSMKYLKNLNNVYLDTAYSSQFLTSHKLEEMIKFHGVDRILFATDSPWSKIDIEKKLLDNTNLKSDELDKIYYKNSFELFKL